MNSEPNFNTIDSELKNLIFEFNRPPNDARLVARKRSHMRFYFFRWKGFAEKPYIVNFAGAHPGLGIEYDSSVAEQVKKIFVAKFISFCRS